MHLGETQDLIRLRIHQARGLCISGKDLDLLRTVDVVYSVYGIVWT
jgi:hypothetical protein